MNGHSPVFVDTVFLVGLFVDGDQWRNAALAAEIEVGSRERYTSDGVIQEFLAHASRLGPEARAEMADQARRMRENLEITVIRHRDSLVADALDLYGGEFLYTGLSLQDCISIQIMRDVGITEILTADQEFALAGLTPLLRRYV